MGGNVYCSLEKKADSGNEWSSEEEEVFNLSAIKEQAAFK